MSANQDDIKLQGDSSQIAIPASDASQRRGTPPHAEMSSPHALVSSLDVPEGFETRSEPLAACSGCGQIQRVSAARKGWVNRCVRCRSRIRSQSDYAAMRSKVGALSLAALCLFPAAFLLPIIHIEQFGHHHRSSLIGGIQELFQMGSWEVGGIVLLFSLVFPSLKLMALLELCWLRWLPSGNRAWLYRCVEVLGKWSMLDVLLLAVMVMWIKLSNLVSFQFGPATLAFAACVALSMTASLSFDPHAIWDVSDDRNGAR